WSRLVTGCCPKPAGYQPAPQPAALSPSRLRGRSMPKSFRLLFGFVSILIFAPAPAAEFASDARLRKDLAYLASDECEGRGVTTRGSELAAQYSAERLKQASLKPGLGDSYFQPFQMPAGGGRLVKPPVLTLLGPSGKPLKLTAGEDYEALGLSGSGKVDGAGV